VTLAWDPNPGNAIDAIAGYRLYEGVANRTYTIVIDVGNVTTNTVTGLAGGVTYFFAVTAYDTNGLESDFSSEISYTVPLPTPAIALTAPVNGASYAAPSAISLVASVTANGHTISQVQFFNGATLLGTVATAPYSFSWTDVSAGTYSLSATAVYDSVSTVNSAAANVTVAAWKPPSGLTFAPDSGTLSAPFVATNGTVFQSVETGVTNGGRAAYSFDIVNAGNYLVSAMVNAPSDAQNSLYVNIDAEPTDPLMIWDIPVNTVLTSQTVSWRGNGGDDPASSQYIPKVFALSAGTHQLIIVGREANSTLGIIAIAATPPTLKIRVGLGGTGTLTGSAQPAPAPVVLSATGQPGQTYNVMCSQDFMTWTLIGTLTLDASGSGEFIDPAGNIGSNRVYCLQGQ
jgi:hypothetical protein